MEVRDSGTIEEKTEKRDIKSYIIFRVRHLLALANFFRFLIAFVCAQLSKSRGSWIA